MRQGFPDKITNEDQDYEVSHILGHHDYKPEGDKEYQREYLVQYRGYDLEDSMWHTQEHLEAQAPKILAKYLKARKEQKTYMQDDLRAVSKNKED